jgi:hypothetical protein
MSVIEKLNDRIRSKITPETEARISAMRGRDHGADRPIEYGADIHDSMWAFSHRAAALRTQQAQPEETAPAMRM